MWGALIPVGLGLLSLIYSVHAVISDFQARRRAWGCFGIFVALMVLGSFALWANFIAAAIAGL